MKNIIEKIIAILDLKGFVKIADFCVPPKPEMGDLSFACFELAKKENKKPNEMANKILKSTAWRDPACPAFAVAMAGQVQDDIGDEKNDIIEKITAVGPYINIFLNSQKIAELILKESSKKDFGKLKVGKGKKILVEFGCPNPMKVFHLGHLKNLITGESVARIMDNAGYKVIRVNYQGDVGLHQAKAMWAIESQKSKVKKLALSDSRMGQKSEPLERRIEFLGQMYAKGAKAYDEDKQAKKEILEMNEKIYKQDKSILPLYKKARAWSLEYFDEIYKKLDARFDRLYFESEMFKRGKEIARDNLKKGVFQESDGAIIFAGSQIGLHDRVFINSKGYPTYEAKELALAEMHNKDYKPNKIIHVVGKEQADYFKVVFKAIGQIWPEYEQKEYHLPGGYLQLKGEKKMSSRAGNVIAGDELLQQTENKVREIMADRKLKNKDEIIRKVTGAVLKYAMLKSCVTQDVSFDMDSSVSLSGDSGPYLLYIVARIRSILKKSQVSVFKPQNKNKFQVPNEIKQQEKALLLKISEYPEMAQLAAENLDPAKISQYLFSLAQTFNHFYGNCPILQEEDESVKIFRVLIIQATEKIMAKGLNLLGIEIVEEM